MYRAKEGHIGKWQCFVLYSLFLLGTVSTFGSTGEAGRDSYISFFVGSILALLLYKIYFAAIKNNFEQGKGWVKAIIWVLTGIAMATAALSASISQNIFTSFLAETSLILTPATVVSIFISITVLILCHGGITVLARTGEVLFWFVVGLIGVSIITSVNQLSLDNLLPFLGEGIKPFANGLFTTVMFPFAEGFFAVSVLFKAGGEENAKAGVYSATLFSSILLTLVLVKNLCVLGFPMVGFMYFPTYTVSSLIILGSFFQRLEVFVSIAFMLCEMIKISLFILYIQDSLTKLIKLKNPVSVYIIVPILFIITENLFHGILAAFVWLKDYRYVLIPGVVIVPLLMLALGKVKKKTSGSG